MIEANTKQKKNWKRFAGLGVGIFVLVCLINFTLQRKSRLQREVEAVGGSYEEVTQSASLLGSSWRTLHQTILDKVSGREFRCAVIELSDSSIDDAWIRRNSSEFDLEIPFALSLDGTQISDRAIRELSDAQELCWLDLSDTDVTDGCIPDLVKLKKLFNVHFEESRISSAGIIDLLNQSSIYMVSIDGNQVTEELVNAMNASAQIQFLEIHQPDSKAILLASQLKHLLSLTISGCGDDVVPQILQLPNSSTIHLYDFSLSSESKKKLNESFHDIYFWDDDARE